MAGRLDIGCIGFMVSGFSRGPEIERLHCVGDVTFAGKCRLFQCAVEHCRGPRTVAGKRFRATGWLATRMIGALRTFAETRSGRVFPEMTARGNRCYCAKDCEAGCREL